jgi:hypothetical protein
MSAEPSAEHSAEDSAEPAADKIEADESRFPKELWVVAALVLWALGVISLLDRTPFGLDEASARVVLLLWSMSDQVPAPIVTLGVPDFRALYLAPAGILFSGSLLAAKICTLIVYLAAIIGLYRWRERDGDSEAALLASGLLLIAPLAVRLIDHLAIGSFLLLSFLLGAWADEFYRSTRMRFGGWYFAQMLMCLALPTLHPAGLAYPLLLAVSWVRSPPPEPTMPGIIPGRERTHVLVGIGVTALCGVLLAGGWPHQGWLANPITALSQELFDFEAESSLGDALSVLLGILLAAGLLVTLWLARARWRADRLASTLVLALLISAFCADGSFALLGLVLLLHWGFPLLLRVRLGHTAGFVGQRGVAFALLMILSTSFLVADRARYQALQRDPQLSAQDRLIQELANSVQQEAQRISAANAQPGLVTGEQKARSGPRVASQWPGRTMIACRCSTLPLPPSTEDSVRFAANLRGIGFVIFDPLDPRNRALSQDFAMLGGATAETLALQAGGVLLRLRTEPVPDHPPEPDPNDAQGPRG